MPLIWKEWKNGGMTEKNLNVKRYVKAQHDLLSYIVKQHLTTGDKLPIESELARMFSVSLITMRHAIGELAVAGIVERFQGKGTFLRKNITEKAAAGKSRLSVDPRG